MNIIKIIRWKFSRMKFKKIQPNCEWKKTAEEMWGIDNDVKIARPNEIYCSKISINPKIFLNSGGVYVCVDENCPYTKNTWLEEEEKDG